MSSIKLLRNKKNIKPFPTEPIFSVSDNFATVVAREKAARVAVLFDKKNKFQFSKKFLKNKEKRKSLITFNIFPDSNFGTQERYKISPKSRDQPKTVPSFAGLFLRFFSNLLQISIIFSSTKPVQYEKIIILLFVSFNAFICIIIDEWATKERWSCQSEFQTFDVFKIRIF